MGLDIKFPIGLMFTIFGVLLTLHGILTVNAVELYEKSLNVNVNLWSGLFMLIFGALMLFLSLRKKKATQG